VSEARARNFKSSAREFELSRKLHDNNAIVISEASARKVFFIRKTPIENFVKEKIERF
jgi:hypothetical protein